MSNPISSLISVPLQSNFNFNLGQDSDAFQYILNVQPVIPITPGPITTPALTWAAAAGVSLVPSHAYNVASANRSDREIDVANPHGRNHLYGLSVENFRMVFDWYLVGNRALR